MLSTKIKYLIYFKSRIPFVFAIFFVTFLTCNTVDEYKIQSFAEINYPEDNPPNKLKEKIGRMLFYDPILSKDSTISCSTCHIQELAFTDGKKVSEGIKRRKVLRNSPSLGNVAYLPIVMRDGGVPTLEMQILVPVQEHAEFDFNIVLAAKRLKNHPIYSSLIQKAFSRKPDPYCITRSIAAFERTIISDSSPFDNYYFNSDQTAISLEAKAGWEVFLKNGCVRCHSGPNFTDYQFHNIGLYKAYADSGRARITFQKEDRGKFKTPSLRNIELTAPYMHDGSFETLEEVINHFSSGGTNHPQKSELINPLNLTDNEKNSLLSFLKSLTDQKLMNDTSLSNPFIEL